MVGNQVIVLGSAIGSLPLSRECGLTLVSLEWSLLKLYFLACFSSFVVHLCDIWVPKLSYQYFIGFCFAGKAFLI